GSRGGTGPACGGGSGPPLGLLEPLLGRLALAAAVVGPVLGLGGGALALQRASTLAAGPGGRTLLGARLAGRSAALGVACHQSSWSCASDQRAPVDESSTTTPAAARRSRTASAVVQSLAARASA